MDNLTVDVITTVDTPGGLQTPTLAMTLDKASLQVASNSGGSSGSGSTTTTSTDPMVATVTNTHDDTVVVENALKIMGWSDRHRLDAQARPGAAGCRSPGFVFTRGCPRATATTRTSPPTATTA